MKMLNIISLGAGVQSSTMALMAAHGEIKPLPDAAIFADTQNEPADVYQWLDFLQKTLPFPIYRVTKGNLWTESIRPRVSKKNEKTYFKFYVPTFTSTEPGQKKKQLTRKCTTDFKVIPIVQNLRKLANIPRGCKEIRIHCWIGISLDEAARMKPSRTAWIKNVFPLIENRLTRADCVKWLTQNKFPIPSKSACIFCPYHNDGLWRDMKANRPWDFAKAVEFEKSLEGKKQKVAGLKSKEFLHQSRVPLDQVDFSTAEQRGQLNFFINECEGLCGV